MTAERRQDVILVALVASVAAHVALMLLIRPQVMTHVAGGAAQRQRPVMTVREARTPPEAVKIESVRDVEAVRESPEAVAEGTLPPAAALDAPGAAPEAAAPAMPDTELPEAPNPRVEIAPFLSEKIHVEEGASSFTTPIAKSEPLAAPAAIAAPESPLAGPVVADVPMFTAPVYVPEVRRESAVSAPTAAPKPDFTPVAEVMPEVDERVVEREKEAVRGLLDVKNAKDLEKAVSVVATSACEGDWTYFRVQLNPRSTLRSVPKDVVVILDASGSIGSDRLASCRSAARRILRSAANTGDRFNLVAFRDRFSYAFRSWQECSQSSFERADRWLTSLAAFGRTDVFATISSVLTLPRDPTRPLIALVVTDGDANAGVRETAQILSKFTALNDGLVSVYMYGVKEGANRELIDVLTHGNRGESFIYGGSRWKAGSGIEGLSERFRDPVLSDLRVVFTTATRAETYPRLLKNLYRGEIVDLVGRVPRGTTEIAFSVKGLNGTNAYEGFFRLDLAASAFDDKLPEAWRNEKAIDEKLR